MKITTLPTIALIAWSGCAFAHTYVVTVLKGTPNMSSSTAHGLNNLGQVAGSVEIANTHGEANTRMAAVWKSADPTVLTSLPGMHDPLAIGINDSGVAVGISYDYVGSFGFATRWNGTTPTNLGTAPGITNSIAIAINSSGEVVGNSTGAGVAGATIWKGTTPTYLNSLGGGGSQAWAVNDAGEVAGGASTANNKSFDATIWSHTNPKDLGFFGGATVANAINAAGHIAGDADSADGSSSVAVAWLGAKLMALSMPPGGILSGARSINNSDEIAGSYQKTGGDQIATLWERTTPLDLNTAIGPTLPASITLNSAEGVNDRGQIAANGTLNGNETAFLLTPVTVALANLLKEVRGVAPRSGLEIEVLVAQVLYDVHDIQASCATLTYFVNQVQALDGRKIAHPLDVQLTTDANAIEIAIGCQ